MIITAMGFELLSTAKDCKQIEKRGKFLIEFHTMTSKGLSL